MHKRQATIAELTAARQAAEAEAARHAAADAEAQAEIAQLTVILKAFQRHRFGARSEQLDEDQLALVFEDFGQALAHAKARVEAARPKRDGDAKRSGRPALPAHLERVERVIAPESTACPCCAGPMHVMGEDVAERLDVVPASFRVLVTRRPRYGCRACESAVVQAPAPPRIIEGGIPTEALTSPRAGEQICRSRGPSTAKRRSTPARASRSIARRLATGSGAPRGG